MEWYLKVLKNYAGFDGRARRKEYWMFVLINFIISIVLYAIMIGGATSGSAALASIGSVLYGVYALGVLIPSLAVGVRRLHDIGKSGWMILVGLIPFVGIIWLIVLLATDSTPGSNEYGPNPKEVGNEEASAHLVES
ncbi:MAG: uncharacterized membrane protein YhaH (DUF805 family) [Bacteroidia bacterium]|jgi:uncharacterized membrane protein YhaH (DUF805 family)